MRIALTQSNKKKDTREQNAKETLPNKSNHKKINNDLEYLYSKKQLKKELDSFLSIFKYAKLK